MVLPGHVSPVGLRAQSSQALVNPRHRRLLHRPVYRREALLRLALCQAVLGNEIQLPG